jgi:hypothetical protein
MSAATYHSIKCRTGKEYGKKAGEVTVYSRKADATNDEIPAEFSSAVREVFLEIFTDKITKFYS